MPEDTCGSCTFRLPLSGEFSYRPEAQGGEKLRCALVRGPIRGADTCDLQKPGMWIEDWRKDDRREPGGGQYKLPKGHERVNYRERVKSLVKEQEPSKSA